MIDWKLCSLLRKVGISDFNNIHLLKNEDNRFVIHYKDLKYTITTLSSVMSLQPEGISSEYVVMSLNKINSIGELLHYEDLLVRNTFLVMQQWNCLAFTPKQFFIRFIEDYVICCYEWLDGIQLSKDNVSTSIVNKLIDINNIMLQKFQCIPVGLDNFIFTESNEVMYIDDDSSIPIVKPNLIANYMNTFIDIDDVTNQVTVYLNDTSKKQFFEVIFKDNVEFIHV